ncbi:choline ABC transporter substrate-binding protein [Oceanobacter mangrovi]|uniref:choline ABC transporter substrate-binding protein n=1 Tax=Oceanobacter mangrovi TaxID=2862510 RepID=UPI001C8E4B45|nr:choline ABC transporter substrate-binding protein [Oceanobacter mangrovi]
MSKAILNHHSLGLVCAGLLLSGAVQAAEPASCQTVHFTDPGWTDISSTNALASEVLKGLGYQAEISTLAVPIGFEALKNAEIDVFLGNWMPAQQKFIDQYVGSGQVEEVRTNLTGAKFTLAVPSYVYDAGVHDFADLAKFADKFDEKIYGIEPGAPANQNLQKMIDSGDFNLKEWTLVESGEQGVISQVKRQVRRNNFIVFLGWEPHPMNTTFDMKYLSGGDDYFGPDYGGATIHTLARKGYREQCGNVGKLLANLQFSLTMENTMMGYIMNDGMEASAAARKYLQANPDVIKPWLEGVTTYQGADGITAVKGYLGL